MENLHSSTMASSSSSPIATPTTFIQADANTFRDLVQKLTGFTRNTDELPLEPFLPFPGGDSTAPWRPLFKLQERRQQHTMMRKLEVELGLTTTLSGNSSVSQCCCPGKVLPLDSPDPSPATPLLPYELMFYSSPGTVSPSSPVVSVSEEEKAIAEKGFYLHPSPRGSQPPKLLTLFPLSSACRDKREYVPKRG